MVHVCLYYCLHCYMQEKEDLLDTFKPLKDEGRRQLTILLLGALSISSAIAV